MSDDKNENINYSMNSMNNNLYNLNNTNSNTNNIHNSSFKNINQPYTMMTTNNINPGMMHGNPNNPNPYSNFYNPVIIQNYYAMYQNMMRAYPNNNPNFYQNNLQNCYTQPYTMNTQNALNIPNFGFKNNQNFTHPSMINMTNMSQPYKNPNYTMNKQNTYNNYNNNNYNNNNKQFHKKHLNLSDYDDLNQTQLTHKPSNPISQEESIEISKWIEMRKRNFPSKTKMNEKDQVDKIKEDVGIMSELEKKLREKIKIIKNLDKKGYNKFKQNNNNNRNNRRRNQRRRNKTKKCDDQPEEGEIVEEQETNYRDLDRNKKEENLNNCNEEYVKENVNKINKNLKKPIVKEKVRVRNGFRYRKSLIYDNLIKTEKFKEMNIILQAFRFFVNENLIDREE